jgi:hypothetical protein
VKRIIFAHGDKGGVGKTQVATRTAAAFRAAGLPLTLIDGDAKNPGLHALFKDAKRCNVLKVEGLEELFEAMVAATNDVLIDLPAGGSAATERMTGNGTSEGQIDLQMLLGEINARAVVLFTINQDREPIAALRDELKVFPDGTEWVVVKNHYQDRAFTAFDESKTKLALEEKGGVIVNLHRLAPDVTMLMAKEGLNLNAFAESEKASLIQKIRAKAAIREWTAQLATAGLMNG